MGIAVTIASPARASDPEAQMLFEEGKRLMAKGDTAAACERLEASQRIEPAGGTLLHLAACREKQGRTATAWALYNEALSAARRAQRRDREQAASERIAALEPRLMRLRIVVGPAARLPELTITRDGRPVDAAAWGLAVPIDPGPREVVASAPGRKSWSMKVDVRGEGLTTVIEVPELARDTGAAIVSPSPPRAADSVAPMSSASTDGSTQRTIGLVVGGVGLLGLGLGTYFGLRSASKNDETDRLCGGPPPADCPRDGVDAANDAQSLGNASTVMFVIGGIALAGGLVLFFTAPRRSDASARWLVPRGAAFRF